MRTALPYLFGMAILVSLVVAGAISLVDIIRELDDNMEGID